ncbi:hypothetical protein MSP8886_02491 [Marinomonas spartinae]|uniref:DKNYY family protein n=1 Tax=Marinomonas spartinae TaxID=1792290 RepID=A0A1A8TGK8_9GAMM|nr:DKNYY domain-containing protein [Marinomonas spartinae]SBS32607.1 hypothetical protein MSP8886_02491 [Marinomonas spartinae]
MSIVINIIITFFILFWPGILMMSPMIFDAPGSENDQGKVLGCVLFMSYPVIIFLILGAFGGHYFGLNPFILSGVCLLIVSLFFFLFGYTEMVVNVIRGVPNSGYGVVRDKVYYNGCQIIEADPLTFKMFKKEDYQYEHSASLYATDKNYFYYRGVKIPDVSVDNLRGKIVADDLYWLNDQYVIKHGKILEHRDPNTFGGYENSAHWTYAKDGQYYKLYYNDRLVEAADFNTFTPLSEPFAKDNNIVFYNDNPIELKVDVHSFDVLPIYGFAKDKDYLYCFSPENEQRVEAADSNTFEEIGGRYYKDKHKVYYRNEEEITVVEQANPDVFQLVHYHESKDYDAKDNQQCYQNGKAFRCDPLQESITD